jgi:DNA repair protein RecO (recombination protein O)
MIQKTKGVVFRFTKYGETSIIVSIFTEAFGLQSYIINGIRSRTARNRIALYQPLTLLDLVVYHRENANINRIKEARCFYVYQHIPTDIRKTACAIFVNEVINKTIREEGHFPELFEFMFDTLVRLDTLASGVEHFPLVFLLKLSHVLGFGVTTNDMVLGSHVASAGTERKLNVLFSADYGVVIDLTIDQRRELLDILLRFYNHHMEWLGDWKSVAVLRDVLM